MLGADAQKWFYDLTIKGKKLFLAWPLAVKEYCVCVCVCNTAVCNLIYLDPLLSGDVFF